MEDGLQAIKDIYCALEIQWNRANAGNKAAGARARKSTLEMEKACKNLRKLSLKKHR